MPNYATEINAKKVISGGQGLPPNVSYRQCQLNPSTKWSDAKILNAERVWNSIHFQRKVSK